MKGPKPFTDDDVFANILQSIKVDVVTGCWEWQKDRDSWGYGRIKFHRKTKRVHRVMWALCWGDIPEEIMVRHTCDNPPCCNPTHFRLGTAAENSSDMCNRGRVKQGENHYNCKLSDVEVIAIRESSSSVISLAKRYNVSHTAISNIRNMKRRLVVNGSNSIKGSRV